MLLQLSLLVLLLQEVLSFSIEFEDLQNLSYGV